MKTILRKSVNGFFGFNYSSVLQVLLIFFVFMITQPCLGSVGGELKKWHKVIITFDGPDTSENAEPNPFFDYRLMVTFSHAGTNKKYIAAGFYAGDGDAGNTGATGGNKWRVYFCPDEAGRWEYKASFRSGKGIAISSEPGAGVGVSFDGESGAFEVTATDKSGRDFRGKGLLRYVGGHYLQFAETGGYFLKGGADSPENFLGYYEFDGTVDLGGVETPGLNKDGLHHYQPHARDWRSGDPTWGGGRGKNIIGAVNYLSGAGGNSIYLITYNIDCGDGRDTWPWTVSSERYRFDCSKLDQWEVVFGQMTKKGVQIHLLTQENENDILLGGDGNLNPVRKLYYRELVARFAHHPVLIWNLGEENKNTDEQRKSFARYIRNLDPYDHPVTVHTFYDQCDSFYDGLLGDSCFEATSIQGDGLRYNHWAVSMRERSRYAGRAWVVYGDEQGPCVAKDISNLDLLRKNTLWGNLMGGGAGVEWYWGYQGSFGDVQSEDWRVAEGLWEDTANALGFFQEYVPFWQMGPDNSLVSADGALCLALPGQIYAVYLPNGKTTDLELGESRGQYSVRWFNPRDGGVLRNGSVTTVKGPGKVSLGTPPAEGDDDWVVVVRAGK